MLAKLASPTKTPSQLRPLNPRRDLEAVADLVEICFGDSMDPDGKRYVERMRSTARNASRSNWTNMNEWNDLMMGGYVWQENDRILGNVSMIPYHLRGNGLFLIANVAVHPDYRNRGIGRKLTERAIEHAQQKGSPSTWLQVREENQTAIGIYLSLGFIERARRTTWYSTPDFSISELPLGTRITAPSSRHWYLQRDWFLSSYPADLSWHIPIKVNAMRPGLWGNITRFFYNLYITQWAIVKGNKLLAVACWQPTTGHFNALWISAPHDCDEQALQSLLIHARQHASSQKSLMIEYPSLEHDQGIQGAGFEKHHTLIWMELQFSK